MINEMTSVLNCPLILPENIKRIDRDPGRYYTGITNQRDLLEQCIQKHLDEFDLKDADLHKIMDQLLKEMEHGLMDEKAAVIKMLPSFVRSVPDGTEHGNFLALDLGGTNFRVLLIKIEGKKASMESKIYRVPQNMMIGTGDQLFDHIAACLASFMKEHDLKKHKLPLGFTFSFPCVQEGLTCARLLTWTKGFSATGVEGEDVVQLLQNAVHRRDDVEIDVVALLNDTTGTLMACAFNQNDCAVGVIVGTGSNACYIEKIGKVPKVDFEDKIPDEVIINTEWGAFGSNGVLDFMRTSFDKEVDKNSINPGKQVFEKMISGMYLGELVRLVLERLTKDGLLFGGRGSDELFTRGRFPTKYLSEIETDLHDDEHTFANTQNILEELGIEGVSATDCHNVALCCQAVSRRAAYLCAAGIAVLLNKMQRPHASVGVDGSVYRYHPTFPDLLDQKVRDLMNPNLTFEMMLSEDGSGRGAALVAAVATRIKEAKCVQK